MNYKRRKPNRRKRHKPYNVVWSYKKSFKRDYQDRDDFKKKVLRNGVKGLCVFNEGRV